MDMQQAFVTCMRKYLVFSGRAARSEYWWFMLGQVLISTMASVISYKLGVLAGLALFLPASSVSIRRLHDVGRSAWWTLVIFVPVIGILILLYWAVQPSQPEDNAYGTPPVQA